MRLINPSQRRRASSYAAGASLLLATLACNFVHGNAASVDTPATNPSPEKPAPFHVDVKQTVEYLASDELEGRGVGSAGLDKAADRVAEDFQKLGLKPLSGFKDYFQPFTMATSVTPDPKTALALGDKSYPLKTDFIPLSFSAEGAFDAPAVFVGYGIASKEHDYDDFAGTDVKGKVVIAMRFEPHNEAGTSRFAKEVWSNEAHLIHKAKVAADHGAAALVLINPPTYHVGDMLMSFGSQFPGDKASIPVIQIRQPVADAWLQQGAHKSLKALQEEIDKSGKPASQALEGVKVAGSVVIHRDEKQVKNVVAVLPGKGEHADEYVVIGSHYDHLGWGGFGSLSPGAHAIHHGADDNASGTSTMLALADHYAHAGPQARTLVFIAFTAEEEGLIGSQHFVSHPPVPLEKVAAMLNLDMVGRVRNNQVYIGGAGTAPSFDAFLKEANVGSPLVLKSFGRGGYGPSDHMSFAMKKVPVMFLFSGMHMDYHRPTDTADKINYDGMKDVAAFATKIADDMVAMSREKYVDAADTTGGMMATGGHGTGSRVTLGVVPDYSETDTTKGVRITGTVPGSPAEKAGLKDGDVLVHFGKDKIDTLYDLTDSLSKAKPGDSVKLGVIRDKKTVELDATLVERKG
ncbi:MAG: peptidase [Phycisphaerales bacterium]|nr:peptidase [Phycisphaerales bacterium]